MPKGVQHEWTADELERVCAVTGGNAHQELAAEFDVAVNTIYSTKQRVRVAGGIAEFLDRQHTVGAPLNDRRAETLAEQLTRPYTIRISGAGRDGAQPQYTVTIPSQLGARWVAEFGRQIRFEPTAESIVILAVPEQPVPDVLPDWAADA